MTSPFDPQWRPPSPRVSGKQIGIAVAIGLSLMVMSYTILGVAIASTFSSGNYYSTTGGSGGNPSGTPLPGGGDTSPITPGAAGVPDAALQTICPTTCFTDASIGGVILPETAFTVLGLDAPDVRWKVEGAGFQAYQHDQNLESWSGSGNESTQASGNFSGDCFPTWSLTPDSDGLGSVQSLDPVNRLLRTTATGGVSVEQWERTFPSTAAAAAHMTTVSTTLAACPGYSDLDGNPTVDIVAEAALPALPDSVAAIGWVRSDLNGARDYVMDVQRANLVIRTTAHSEGGLTETDFRALMVQQVALLGQVTPE